MMKKPKQYSIEKGCIAFGFAKMQRPNKPVVCTRAFESEKSTVATLF